MQSGQTPQVEDQFADLGAPTQEDLSYQIQQLVQQGVLSPEDAKAALLGRSEMNNITLDPNLKRAQMDALSSLQEISDGGGMTLADEANLNKIRSEEDAAAKGKRDAIIQNAQARGMGGSGLELMSQMQNQQDSATRASQRGLDIAAMAQERALQALMQGGQLAGNIQNQDFNQQAQIAGANDAISKFNATNTQNVNMANTAARNDAQAKNLGLKQDIANQNANLQTQQNAQKATNAQQAFDNQIKKRSGQAGIATQNANAQGQNSQNAANANNQMIGSLIGAGMAAAGAKGKYNGGIIEGEDADFDNQLTPTSSGEFVVRKEDVPEFLKKAHTDDDGEFDAAGFLDSITGHKYNYKGKK